MAKRTTLDELDIPTNEVTPIMSEANIPALPVEHKTKPTPQSNHWDDTNVEIPEEDPKVEITFRLSYSLIRRLEKTTLQRKMRKARPYTKQGIAEEAIEKWLDREHPKGTHK